MLGPLGVSDGVIPQAADLLFTQSSMGICAVFFLLSVFLIVLNVQNMVASSDTHSIFKCVHFNRPSVYFPLGFLPINMYDICVYVYVCIYKYVQTYDVLQCINITDRLMRRQETDRNSRTDRQWFGRQADH